MNTPTKSKKPRYRPLIRPKTIELIGEFLDGVPYDDPDFQDAIAKDLKRMSDEARRRTRAKRATLDSPKKARKP